MSSRITIVCFLALFGFLGLVDAKPLILVGVLESQPDPIAPEGAPARDHMRVAFRFRNGTWAAACEGKPSARRNDGCEVPEPQEPKQWHVVFDGRGLGDVETAGWRSSEYYSFTGALTTTTLPLPRVEEPEASFPAWWGQPKRRPLVAVSGQAVPTIGQTWHREPVRQRDPASAWPLFQARVPIIPNCKFSDDGKPLGIARRAERSDVIVFDRVRIVNGGVLLGVRARTSDDCAEDGGFASDFWILKSVNGPAFALEGFDMSGWGYSLKLVDMGSYAGDGTQQAVFAYSGYNEDGYVLYYDGLRKRVQFTWGYH